MLRGMAAAALVALPGAGRLRADARETGCRSCDSPMLVVDLDRAMLYALAGARIEIASRVIVGAPASPTPQTSSVLDTIRFRPTWRPTPDMVRSGRYVDGLRPPGPSNPLGLAAIRFRGGGLVYLHGTNDPALFARERRALSNGCVRVEALTEVVGWVLGWPEAEVRAAMHGRHTFDVPAPAIPFQMSADRNDPMLALLARLSEPASAARLRVSQAAAAIR